MKSKKLNQMLGTGKVLNNQEKGIQQEPFRKYNLESGQDSFTVKLSKDGKERELLNKCKQIIEQPKDSTALKSLAWLGAKVLHEEKMLYAIRLLFKNRKKNERLGVADFEDI